MNEILGSTTPGVRKGLLQLHCALKMVTLASCVVLVDYSLVVQQIQVRVNVASILSEGGFVYLNQNSFNGRP